MAKSEAARLQDGRNAIGPLEECPLGKFYNILEDTLVPLEDRSSVEEILNVEHLKQKKSGQSLPALPHTPETPTKAMECEIQISKWEAKFSANCSSPSRPEWHSFVKGTKLVLTQSQLQEHELHIHQERRIEDQERKVTRRKVLQKFGRLTKRDAQEKLDAIKRKEEEVEACC
jgi:hypothetical protein